MFGFFVSTFSNLSVVDLKNTVYVAGLSELIPRLGAEPPGDYCPIIEF